MLRTLVKREDLSTLANDLNLTSTAAELGVFRGEFAEHNMKKWHGNMYFMIDKWAPTDCVGGNESVCVYPNESRSYDRMITQLRMDRGGALWKGRWLQ